ncbi:MULTISPECIES: hypothetical protein [unclassified Mycolicibacterium]|uniref:hypothetical protein n=1 Tax=unclassified Mycolicibacterium TaxID=2636767 RepID=UPI002ED9AD08
MSRVVRFLVSATELAEGSIGDVRDVCDLDRPRIGPIMMAWLAALPVLLLITAALGVYDLQRWLERWDHDRHLSD